MAAIRMCESYRGNESLCCHFEAFSASASDFRGQHMLHKPSDDSLVRAWLLSRVTGRRFQGSATISTQNDSVKQFVAVDLLAFASKVFGRKSSSHRLCFHLIDVQASSVAA